MRLNVSGPIAIIIVDLVCPVFNGDRQATSFCELQHAYTSHPRSLSGGQPAVRQTDKVS